MKTIVVTGGGGFVGSFLCEALLAMGERVICVDNFLTSAPENIAHLRENPNFVLVEHDIIQPLYLDEKIDQIYNLACPASPVHYQNNAVRTIKVNTVGMINMLGMARAQGATLLQASTSEVYGDPEVHPQVEEYRGNVNPIGPRACYDEGKRCAETLCFDYRRMHGMPVKVVRIFNTYGPRMALNDGRVVSNFVVQALRGEEITLYGEGQQTRSFCYVTDLVQGLIKMMATDPTVTGPINLGNPNECTVKELAELVVELTGSSSQLVYQDLPQDDPTRRRPDITKAKSVLAWQPTVDLKTGLEKTIAYFKTKVWTSYILAEDL